VRLSASGNTQAAVRACSSLEEVRDASWRDGGIDLIVDQARTLLPQILQVVGEAGAVVSAVEVTEPNLEAVFLHLTGKALRD
jgi:ABC-2 type transport system ATP-binding protein